MGLGPYAGFYVQKPHPDPSQPPIQMPLLDDAWTIGEKMVATVDEVFNDIALFSVSRYNASAVKRVPPTMLRAFDTTDTTVIEGSVHITVGGLPAATVVTYTTSQEDRFGNFLEKHNVLNHPTTSDLNIFSGAYSDPRIKNGLDPMFLKDASGNPSDVFKKKGYLLRNWAYQEIEEDMGWVLLHIDAFWDRGPLFKLGCGVYHSTWPQAPYYNLQPFDLVGTVLPVGFLVGGYWNVYYNFEHAIYNDPHPPSGSATIHKIFQGPAFYDTKPHLYDIVTIQESTPLIGYGPLRPDNLMDSGVIRWQSIWQTVPPELAPFIIYDCPYS